MNRLSLLFLLFAVHLWAAQPESGKSHRDDEGEELSPRFKNRWATNEDFWKDLKSAFQAQKLEPRLAPPETQLHAQDPTKPICEIWLSQDLTKSEHQKLVKDLVTLIGQIDPNIKVHVLQTGDYPGYQPPPFPEENQDDTDFTLRDVRSRVVTYRAGKEIHLGPWRHLDMSTPTVWARDLMVPFRVGGKNTLHFTQVPHRDIPAASLQKLLGDAHGPMGYTQFNGTSSPGKYYRSEQFAGGNFVPLNPQLVVRFEEEDRTKSRQLARHGIQTLNLAMTFGSTNHVDEVISVVPAPQSPCKIALLYSRPVVNKENEASKEAREKHIKAVEDFLGRARKSLNCPSLQAFPIDVKYNEELLWGSRPQVANPINSLVFPLKDKTVLLVPKLDAQSEKRYRAQIAEIAEKLKHPFEIKFVDAPFLNAKGGDIHCVTNEIRCSN